MQILPTLGIFKSIKLNKNSSNLFLFTYLFILILFIGLRHQVGGDWYQYSHIYANPYQFSVLDFSIRNDYFYNYLSFLFYNFGLSYHYLNFLLAIFFVISVYKFCKLQPSIALSLIISFPIIIMIMGMGFARQGIAFAFVLFAMVSFIKENKIGFLTFAITAILFHKSAILILGIYPFIDKEIKYLQIFFIFLIGLFIIYILRGDFYNLYDNYLGSNLNTNAEERKSLNSQGAPIRIALNFLASIIYLVFMREISQNSNEKKLCIFIVICVFILLVLAIKYSVFADRINYYLTPIQIIVFSRLPFIFNKKPTQEFFTFSIASFYIAILIIWINFSVHAHAWLPYQNIIFNG